MNLERRLTAFAGFIGQFDTVDVRVLVDRIGREKGTSLAHSLGWWRARTGSTLRPLVMIIWHRSIVRPAARTRSALCCQAGRRLGPAGSNSLAGNVSNVNAPNERMPLDQPEKMVIAMAELPREFADKAGGGR
jgi:hypothetical protein